MERTAMKSTQKQNYEDKYSDISKAKKQERAKYYKMKSIILIYFT